MKNLIKNILLVDDDYSANFYNLVILKRSKIAENIIEVDSGIKALDYLINEENILPEVVLLDINMPMMNGWDFLKKLEELNNPRLANLDIFMLSSSYNPDDRDTAKIFKNVKGYLSKPFNADDLKKIYT